MADALVERRPTVRFFCHRCNVEFEDVLQDYTCPFCASGFIEQLENEAETGHSGDDFSDADMSNLEDMSTLDDMSNLDDSDDVHQSTPPMLNDLAFLVSGGRLRGEGRRETLMEQLVWMISGARNAGAAAGGGGGGGGPFVLVGAPGDYVFGGEGLDAVVTQLLGQLENAGPPPLPRDQIAAIPSEQVTQEQVDANASCSVCWENFQSGETISRLQCDHIFHETCITPWLQLHATCPVCRRSLLPEGELEPEPAPSVASAASAPSVASAVSVASALSAPSVPASHSQSEGSSTSMPQLVVRLHRSRGSNPDSSSTSAMSTSSVTGSGSGWTTSDSSSSLTSRNDHHYMDMDFD